MKGSSFSYDNFVVYPEYCELSYSELCRLSLGDSNFHAATLPLLGYNTCVVFYGGRRLLSRPKCRLHSSEEDVSPGEARPAVFVLGGKRVLMLICYEIVFPEDYLPVKMEADLVIHMVGQPMFSEEQREGWIALQKAISLIYRCPVVCCCGGKRGRMNITGVVKEVM